MRALPHRCQTCGGTGQTANKIPGSSDTVMTDCSNCIDGSDGFVVFDKGEDPEAWAWE